MRKAAVAPMEEPMKTKRVPFHRPKRAPAARVRIEPGTKATQLLFKPLNGTVSGPFDREIKHFGIDIVAPKNEVVKAVQDGTVTLASYTTDGGYVIQVQHAHNLISVYKHNSALFKKAGETVVAGESIAVIGDTGDHTDGPHLHFELWQDGNAVDPAEYFEW